MKVLESVEFFSWTCPICKIVLDCKTDGRLLNQIDEHQKGCYKPDCFEKWLTRELEMYDIGFNISDGVEMELQARSYLLFSKVLEKYRLFKRGEKL